VSIRQGFDFPISAITAIPAILAALCLRPSAIDPTPHRRFVENKDQTPIRPSGHRTVEVVFSRFSGLQSRPISALFSGFYCSGGRGSQTFWLNADC